MSLLRLFLLDLMFFLLNRIERIYPGMRHARNIKSLGCDSNLRGIVCNEFHTHTHSYHRYSNELSQLINV